MPVKTWVTMFPEPQPWQPGDRVTVFGGEHTVVQVIPNGTGGMWVRFDGEDPRPARPAQPPPTSWIKMYDKPKRWKPGDRVRVWNTPYTVLAIKPTGSGGMWVQFDGPPRVGPPRGAKLTGWQVTGPWWRVWPDTATHALINRGVLRGRPARRALAWACTWRGPHARYVTVQRSRRSAQ